MDYLRAMWSTDIRAVIPQLAMSAGTMIACSCKEIVMGKQQVDTAQREMIEANVRLVISIAKRFRNKKKHCQLLGDDNSCDSDLKF